MSKYYNNNDYYNDDREDPVGAVAVLLILFLIYKYYTNRADFWHWLIYGIIITAFLVTAYIFFLKFREKRRMVYRGVKNINTNIIQAIEKMPNEYRLEKTNYATPQAEMLYNALIKRGIKCEKEKWDGYKHIDIAITWAKINIEVDGNQHYTDPKQMIADYKRNYYSNLRGYQTIRLPNFIIEQDLDEVADSIAQVALGAHYGKLVKA